MRVISQDGNFDLPYENLAIFIEYENVAARFENERYLLARYSSEAKAIKAMEMLREQYARLETIKALASGTCEHMEKSLEPEEFKDILKKYINMEVFQFPQDDGERLN